VGVSLGVMFGGFVGMMVGDVMMGFSHSRQFGLRRDCQCEGVQEHADQQHGENSLHIPSFSGDPVGKDYFIPEPGKIDFSFLGGLRRLPASR
jgi:hypothetical protein